MKTLKGIILALGFMGGLGVSYINSVKEEPNLLITLSGIASTVASGGVIGKYLLEEKERYIRRYSN
jgi:hypothetical protein